MDVSGGDENYGRQIVDVLSVVAQKNDFPNGAHHLIGAAYINRAAVLLIFIKSSASSHLSTPGNDQGLGRKEAEHVNLRVKPALIA